MINLLPPETRESIMYARRNTQLRRWVIAMASGIMGIVVVVGFGYLYISQTTTNISKQVEQAEQELKVQKLEETQKRVEDISSSLKLVTQVLSRQILFSEVLQQTGAVMPSGSSLAGLTLTQLQGGIDLRADAINYETATQVQVNLQDPNNKLFESVDIIDVSCGETAGTTYPCSGTYRALFSKNNPYLLLNAPPTGSTP